MHIEAGGAVRDLTAWKRNADASHLVRPKATTLDYRAPAVVKSNVTPAALRVGRQPIYFFPDVALIEDKGTFGMVGYNRLSLRWQNSCFIEDDAVPRDATVVDHTWAHPNKSGGPDRRFRDNRQIPVCLYETMHLTSASGLNELVEVSKYNVAKPLLTPCAPFRGTKSPSISRRASPARRSSPYQELPRTPAIRRRTRA